MGAGELVRVEARVGAPLARQLLYSAAVALEQLEGQVLVLVVHVVEHPGLRLHRVGLAVAVPLHCEAVCSPGVALPEVVVPVSACCQAGDWQAVRWQLVVWRVGEWRGLGWVLGTAE